MPCIWLREDIKLKNTWLHYGVFFIAVTMQSSEANSSDFKELNQQQTSAIADFLKASQKVWQKDYGNVHYVMMQTWVYRSETEKKRVVTEINYWSRDNRFFRMDTKIIESTAPSEIGKRTRLIISPDGYISLKSDAADSPLAIIEWGSTEQGLDWLLGNFSVLASVRCRGLMFFMIELDELSNTNLITEVPQFLVREEIKRTLTDFQLINGGSVFEATWTHKEGQITYESVVRCDKENGVVLTYEGKTIVNGLIGTVVKEKKEYDTQLFRGIPSHYFYKADSAASSDAAKYLRTIEFKTLVVDWTPVQLGVFSFQAQGLSSVQPTMVWSRRLWILCLGILLIGVVYLIKRAKYRAI